MRHMKLSNGTEATKIFYDRIGWQLQGDTLVDQALFAWGKGELRDALDTQRKSRIREMVPSNQSIIELGSGATPAVFLAKGSKSYTAVDFSPVGLSKAAEILGHGNVPFKVVESDITNLPFDDAAFDIAYSAHAIYHIDTVEGQTAAFREAMRVTRRRAIFVMANPFPLLFPYRMLRRVLAVTPGVNWILNRLRTKPPLPYLPMPIGWMKRELAKGGNVTVTGYALATVDFSRRVSEKSVVGSLVWRIIAWLETMRPEWVARLGNYVVIVVDKD